MNEKHCGTCDHFIGGGDWNLCCDLPHPEAPCGFLCYKDTPACEKYKPKDIIDFAIGIIVKRYLKLANGETSLDDLYAEIDERCTD